MKIQRPKPIVEQVIATLRQRIQERVYPPGSRLPSESELAQELGVSRTTVRTALSKFAAEGLILRKQGDGTYINERIEEVDMHYGGLWDFSRIIEANGFAPSIQTLSLEQRSANEQEQSLLEIAPDVRVFSLRRLFCADGQPVILTTNVFPDHIFERDFALADGNMPIHEILRHYSREEIAYVISDIEATVADSALQQLLKRSEKRPLLHLNETFLNKEHHPIMLGSSFYDFTALKLRLVRAWG